MALRPYQKEALDSAKEKFSQGIRRLLIVLPTGMGKTPTFAKLRDHFGFKKKIMVLAHREELVNQAADKIRTWNPKAHVDVEMGAEHHADPNADFVVGSVPTLGRNGSLRLLKFNPDDYDAIVVDEAHHITGTTYANVCEFFGLDEETNTKLLLGVTATSKRGDDQALGQWFDEIAYEKNIRDGIKEGWLSPPRAYIVRTTTSLDAVRAVHGDFKLDELADAVDNPLRNGLIVESWIKNANERPTIAFTVDINHAKNLAMQFNMAGVLAAPIWGTDPERKAKIAAHREGKIKILCNCGVLTEGYDDWRVSCVVMARPTKSALLFTQCIGRGLRLQEGIDNLILARKRGDTLIKKDCLVFDVTDNSQKHRLTNICSLFGLPAQLNLQGMEVVEALEKLEDVQAQYPTVDFSGLTDLSMIDAYMEEVDLLSFKFPDEAVKASPLTWYKTFKGTYMLTLPDGEYIECYPDALDQWSVKGTVKQTEFIQHKFKDEHEAIQFGDSMVRIFGHGLLTALRRDAKRNRGDVTKVQISMLKGLLDEEKFVLLPLTSMKRGEAQLLINKLMHDNMIH